MSLNLEALRAAATAARPPVPPRPAAGHQPAFREVFAAELAGLRVSQHAQARLAGRNISLSPAQVDRLEAAVQRAAARGAGESLVLLDGTALIVSVKNRTVITAASGGELKSSVFTNIDSAVLA